MTNSETAEVERKALYILKSLSHSREPLRIGMILLGGLNPIAAAEEAGIETENYAMSTIMEYENLNSIWELVK